MKKLIDNVDDVVIDALSGMAAAHSDLLRLLPEPKVLMRADVPACKVALVSGGGSGHEPLHGGFVGYGMLDAACAGEIFTSPTPDQVYEAARAVDRGRGVLLIVKNYTGDVLNFEMARDMLLADGVEVEQVLVNDDVAVKDSLYTAGRRGVAGTVLVEKIAGALAESGASLAEVKALADRCVSEVRSMGVALSSCISPAAGKPTFDLPDDEMELGIGIHGEPGRERKKIAPAREIVEYLAGAIIGDLPFREGDEVLAFVNGMGGSPISELYVVYNDLTNFLRAKGIGVARSLVGTYATSLEMQGCSISLLRMDERMKELWDSPVQTASLRWGR